MQSPLAGIHVVNVSTGLPGAYCAKLLTDLGAETAFLDGPHQIGGKEVTAYLRTSRISSLTQFPMMPTS